MWACFLYQNIFKWLKKKRGRAQLGVENLKKKKKKDFKKPRVGIRNLQCLCERLGQGGACCVWEALGLTVSAFNVNCFIMLSWLRINHSIWKVWEHLHLCVCGVSHKYFSQFPALFIGWRVWTEEFEWTLLSEQLFILCVWVYVCEDEYV